MKIVVDAFGGDNAPEQIVLGAIKAVKENNGFSVVLVGQSERIKAILTDNGFNGERIIIEEASDVITNDEVPTDAIRTKRDSSLVKCFDYLNANDDAKAFVSAGSTGAVLTGAVLLLRRIRGINRPALCPVLPTVIDGKQAVLIDCGANVDTKSANLIQFGIMGSAFVKATMGIERPKVALLSNGAEDKKGNALNKEAFPLMKEAKFNFCGNIEARDMLSGDIDVIVSDGFNGNIALKACEGTALSMFSLIKKGIMNGGLRTKIGFLLLKPVFRKVKHTMDYNDNGGAVLLGLEKIVIKSHGSSKAKAICNSILQAKNMVDAQVVEAIKTNLAE